MIPLLAIENNCLFIGPKDEEEDGVGSRSGVGSSRLVSSANPRRKRLPFPQA
jgi:hypothetical protein